MINKICKVKCDDPICKEFGCLNQPAWKFRDDIIFARQYNRNTPMAELKDFLTYLHEHVCKQRENARFSGQMGDSGAGELEAEIEIYKAGVQCGVPETWASHYKQFLDEQDPEYAKYIELKEKFK